jgi:4-amino-4-deoxy-L-arabinose transferase-like glycosyltransferase
LLWRPGRLRLLLRKQKGLRPFFYAVVINPLVLLQTQLFERACFSKTTYYFLFTLLALVYAVGLFVPLMDNDSAHHANIALHMYLTGDYVSLIDHHGAYLDKPHLHFWLCAFSYKIFGVNTFAYKLPSFLFSVLGVYSTFRLGKLLYNEATGKLAALYLLLPLHLYSPIMM